MSQVVMCPSVSRLRSVYRVVQDDFYEARIEACVDDVFGDVRSLASRPYHVTDSGTGLAGLAHQSQDVTIIPAMFYIYCPHDGTVEQMKHHGASAQE